jgi:hypothetical protein
MAKPEPVPNYRVVVEGRIDRSWSEWLEGMSIRYGRSSAGSAVTILTGPLADQSALRGLLSKIWNLNLSVLAVRRVGTASANNQSAGGV